MKRKFGDLPEASETLKGFEAFDGRVRVLSTQISDLDVWSLRYSEPDKSTAGRDWIVEVTSLKGKDTSHFSCRLSCYSSEQNFSFIPSTPAPLKEVVGAMSFFDQGSVFSPDFLELGVDISTHDLIRQLTNPKRWWNVVVVAESFNDVYGIDATSVHRNIMGVANTVFVPSDLEQEFADAVGYDFRVFGGGARTFRPEFDIVSSEFTAHPVIKAPFAGNPAERNRALHILCADAFRNSVERRELRELVPSFSTMLQLSARQASDVARSQGDFSAQIDALEELVEAERKNTQEAIDLAIQHDEDLKLLQQDLNNERSINFGLQKRIEMLAAKVETLGSTTETPEPESYVDLKSWVEENFSGEIRLHPRAEKSLKSARYEKISDVIAAIRLLAKEYRGMKQGKIPPATFEEACLKVGLEESKTLSKTSAGKQGDEYFVNYARRRQFLDRHLKKGNSRDQRYCMRVYFFWDDENEIVVIGSLPGHLNTSAT